MEVAFKAKQDSDFYNQYFQAKTEKQLFHELAKAFFKTHRLSAEKYTQTERLCFTMTAEEKEAHKSSILTKDNKYGLRGFKKNSELNKAWFNGVYSQINHKIIDSIKFWYFGCFSDKGSYATWDADNEIYGMLSSDGKVTLPKWSEEIKMSEYYQAVEKCEENK